MHLFIPFKTKYEKNCVHLYAIDLDISHGGLQIL